MNHQNNRPRRISSVKGGLQSKDTKPVTEAPNKKKFLTSWCGGMGCDNCKACLIFSGKAKLIKADDRTHILTYRIVE